MKTIKPCIIEGEEFASLCHSQTANGPLIIDVNMNTLTPKEAIKLANWLIVAAHIVKTQPKPKPEGEK